MSAPERIWTTGNAGTGSWNSDEGRMKFHMPDDWQTEYVRADLYATQSARIATLESAQSYTYIGKDGKPVLARDLEDQRDAMAAPTNAVNGEGMMVDYINFNANDYVKVILTDYGRELHLADWESVCDSDRLKQLIPYVAPVQDSDGYVEFQLWHLMELFGGHMRNDRLPFTLNMKVQNKGLSTPGNAVKGEE